MPNKLLSTLFKPQFSLKRLLVSVIGFIIGLSITLVAIEVSQKTAIILDKSDAHYLILNKKISLLSNTIFNKKPTFSKKEIKDLNAQNFIERVAPITSSNYQISAYSDKLGFRTDLFFESVPSEMIDVYNYKFNWEEGDETIPIIVPKDFLHLYNFGFAQSQGTRTIPASMVKTLEVTLKLKNENDEKLFYKGRVVGLSDRIPTILVPNSFNEYTNKTFAKKKNIPATRLLIAVKNPSHPALIDFLKKHRYETNNDKLNSNKIGLFITILSGVLLFIGAMFIILSFINIVLSFDLIISKSQDDVKLLLEIGYTPKHISKFFSKYLFVLIGGLSLIALIISISINHFIQQKLAELGYTEHPYISTITIISFILIIAGTITKFKLDIRKIINKYW